MKKNILVAVDSFKNCATSKQLGTWIAEVISDYDSSSICSVMPIADGGEGTLDALMQNNLTAKRYFTKVHDPFDRVIDVPYAVVNESIGIIEVAKIYGYTQSMRADNDAQVASSCGVGEVILELLNKNVHEIVIGLGGSCVTDGGSGLLKALNVQLLDSKGQSIKSGLRGLHDLAHISEQSKDHRLKSVKFTLLCDVDNPLIGPEGTVQVFGPQKGLDPEKLKMYERWMQHYAELLENDFGFDPWTHNGSGAAGGLGAAFMVFCHAEMKNGIGTILSLIGLDRKIQHADLVITGEGSFDLQSLHGKAPIGIASIAKENNVPVICFTGSTTVNISEAYDKGISALFPIVIRPMTLDESVNEIENNIKFVTLNAYRSLLVNI